MPTPGVYQFKVDTKSFSASPMGEMAEKLEAASADSMYALEKALVDACKEVSGFPEFNYQCDQVTPKVALFTACIGTAKIGGGGGGGGAPVAAAAAAGGGGGGAAKAPEPEPEPEEEE